MRRGRRIVWVLGAALLLVATSLAPAAPSTPAKGPGGTRKVTISKVVLGKGLGATDFDFHVCQYLESMLIPTEDDDVGVRPAGCESAEQFPIATDDFEEYRWGNPPSDVDPTFYSPRPIQITELISAAQYNAGWRFESATCSPNSNQASEVYEPAPTTANEEVGGRAYSVLFTGKTSNCQFINTRVAGIRVVKDASENDPQNFSFRSRQCVHKSVAYVAENLTTRCRGPITSFVLDDDSTSAPPGHRRTLSLRKGTYWVREGDLPEGWFLESITCTGVDEDRQLVQLDKRRVLVRIRWGEFPECVFRNVRKVSAGQAPSPITTLPPPPPPPSTSSSTTTTTEPRSACPPRCPVTTSTTFKLN